MELAALWLSEGQVFIGAKSLYIVALAAFIQTFLLFFSPSTTQIILKLLIFSLFGVICETNDLQFVWTFGFILKWSSGGGVGVWIVLWASCPTLLLCVLNISGYPGYYKHVVLITLCLTKLFHLLSDEGSFPYKTKSEQRHRVSLREQFTEADLKSLSELNPPSMMQNGNVGTPVKVFLQLIQSCRLPPRLIRKLGLTFPKTSSNRRYGNVPFQYQDTYTLPATEETVLTASGHEISGPGTLATAPSGPRQLVFNSTETKETDELHNNEEDAESNADDVGISWYLIAPHKRNLSVSVIMANNW